MPRNIPGEPYTRISAEEAKDLVNSGDSIVIDVRNEDEYLAGHVKDAIWIPVDDIIDRHSELPSDKNLLFICEVGARSGLAAEYASSMGSDNSYLYNIDDGTSKWIAKGLPSSKGTER
ncbi:MAG: rhodanese-like domain-containing protein [Dehalococcoidia bacterium]|tara:strand:- start:462 stop:815 length:354 start_codon:yes stop_codon:yes gene_type:complete